MYISTAVAQRNIWHSVCLHHRFKSLCKNESLSALVEDWLSINTAELNAAIYDKNHSTDTFQFDFYLFSCL